MTDISSPQARLGVGQIIGDSFSIFFKNIVPIIMLVFIPTLIGQVLTGVFAGWGALLGEAPTEFVDPQSLVIGPIVGALINFVLLTLVTAFVVLLAYDAKLGRPITPSRYMGPALKSILPIIVLSIVVGILTSLGIMALIIPGFWVMAVFYVTTPSIVIEKSGFGGMGRSAALTKEYRWPIVGLVIVLAIINMLLSFGALFIAGAVIGLAGGGLIVTVLLLSLAYSVTYGIGGIANALTYARLREIKEGVSVDEIASVFE